MLSVKLLKAVGKSYLFDAFQFDSDGFMSIPSS